MSWYRSEFNEHAPHAVCKSVSFWCTYCSPHDDDKEKLVVAKNKYSYGNATELMEKYKSARDVSFYAHFWDEDECDECLKAKGLNPDDYDSENRRYVNEDDLWQYINDILEISYAHAQYLSTALLHYFADIFRYDRKIFKHILLYCLELGFRENDKLISHDLYFVDIADTSKFQYASLTLEEYTAGYAWHKRRYPIVALYMHNGWA